MVSGELAGRLAGLGHPAELVAAVREVSEPSAVVGYLGDAAACAAEDDAAAASYVACVLATASGGGAAAFEAERAWQARWLSGRLGLADG